MWALLNKLTNIVEGVLIPTAPPKVIEEAKNKWNLIEMTLENSPASIGDKYINNKFISEGN